MAEGMSGLVSEAKKGKFSTIGNTLSEEDAVSVWDNVSEYIERQMTHQKGVHITGLGTFSFSQKKLDVGNNRYLLVQRPIFILSEKFAQTHGLNYQKYHTPGQIPVVQLNFAALAIESPFDRDAVESCVKEVLQALNRSVAAKRNVEFTFTGVGRLQIRDSRVKMKFYKDFVHSMDGSGHLVESLQNRPGTVDSVISNRSPSRLPTPNTLHLPRITNGLSGLEPHRDSKLAPIQEDGVVDDPADDVNMVDVEPKDPCDVDIQFIDNNEEPKFGEGKSTSRAGSRMVAPIATVCGFSHIDDLMNPPASGSQNPLSKSSPAPLAPLNDSPKNPGGAGGELLTPLPKPPTPPSDMKYPLPPTPPTAPRDGDLPLRPKSLEKLLAPSPPRSACGHQNAGQELCYLCHQRERKNIPVSFTEERQRREQEEDRLLQQFQHLRDTEAILKDQAEDMARRHENQKMAAFNLGVSEAVKTKKVSRDLDFHPSYVFQRTRPLTPPRYVKQNEMFKDLAKQVNSKQDRREKQRSDEHFLERLEQVQLAEDLAAQREQYLRGKAEQQEQYKRALSAQVKFKPLPLPAREPDSTDHIFGKNDMTNEKLNDKRRLAHELYKDQLDVVAQRKREAILKRLAEQKEEEDVLKRTKEGLFHDRAGRYERMFSHRKRLEEDWADASKLKLHREREERIRSMSPGVLLHEQCDKYNRCKQCKRCLANCGESNIWCDSRYIPGSRLIV
ncbi:coiled-coil domain-containing protein 81-like isoform X2 [Lineus longissimus]|uniref:coiled-coil domain-containing protein 81-like isoform X2 n=1 Tax=Lineus longissimus TaxID=88925 RepID=UPI002B4F5B19